MLFAVEGGGFFSSSASGYSKGLTLLLLGQKSEEKPMRVTPWNQYQLVDQETEPDLQLASGKKRLVRGCASFKCFGRAPDGLESPSHLKVGPAQNEEVLPEPPLIDESKDHKQLSNTVEDGDINRKIINLKSSLKKTTNSVPAAATDSGGKGNNSEHEEFCGRENDEQEAFYGREHDVTCQTERRKVQWTDTTGGELFQIREFEMSDESDDEFHHGNDKTCSCTIM